MKTLYLDCGMGAAGDMLTAALLELLPEPDAFVEKLNGLSIPGVQVKKEEAVKCGITGTHISVMVRGMEESEEMHEHGHVHYHEDEHGHGHHHEHSHDHEHHHDYEHDHEHHHGHEHSHEHHHEYSHEHEHGYVHEHHHEHSHEHGHAHHHHSGMHDIEHIISDLQLSEKVRENILAVYGLIAEAEGHVHGKPITEIHFHEVGTMDAIADVTAVCLLMEELSPDEVVVSPIHV